MIRATRLLEQRFRFFGAEDNRDGAVATDARRSWSERRTLLLALEDAEGRLGTGEAAPLPDYSPDTLDDAWNALAPLVGKPLGSGELGASGSSRELLRVTSAIASPSARFALESAILDLWSQRTGEPAWALLARIFAELSGSSTAPTSTSGELTVAALLSGSAEQALRQAEAAAARGIGCFKVKIGAPSAWPAELATLGALRQRFPDARLRVDANQSLSLSELGERLPALRELALEWLEEPVPRYPDGIEAPLGVPVALDESLQTAPPDPMAARDSGVAAYVLKPTTLGGFVRSFELAQSARSAGLGVATSHAYEGPVGFSAIAALSLALGPGRPPDGLDHHPGVADTPVFPAFDAARGRIRTWSEPGFGLPLPKLLETREILRELRG